MGQLLIPQPCTTESVASPHGLFVLHSGVEYLSYCPYLPLPYYSARPALSHLWTCTPHINFHFRYCILSSATSQLFGLFLVILEKADAVMALNQLH